MILRDSATSVECGFVVVASGRTLERLFFSGVLGEDTHREYAGQIPAVFLYSLVSVLLFGLLSTR